MFLEREQYYLDLNMEVPSYNILKVAGSLLGHIHPPKFRATMSKIMTGKIFSPETRVKMSEAQKGKVMSPEVKAKISNTKGTSIYVYSKDHKLESSFSSARECAKFFNVSKNTILRYAVNEKLFQEKWILSVKEVSN